MAKDESKEEGKRPDKKMLIIAGALVTVMLVVMGVLVVVLLKVSAPPPQDIAEVQAVPVLPEGTEAKPAKEPKKQEETVVKAEKSEKSEGKHGEKKSDKPSYYKFSPAFIVNIPSNGRLRFLQVEVQLMAKNEDDLKNIEAYAPVIRNDLITLFSSQNYDDLLTPDGKENLRKSSLAVSRKILKENSGSPSVEQVLFTNFVTQ